MLFASATALSASATISLPSFLLNFSAIAIVVVGDLWIRFGKPDAFFECSNGFLRSMAAVAIGAFSVYLFGVFEAQDFIYFQF